MKCFKFLKIKILIKKNSLPSVLHTGEWEKSNFVIEYLREFEKFRKTVLGCSSGAQMCLIHEKK